MMKKRQRAGAYSPDSAAALTPAMPRPMPVIRRHSAIQPVEGISSAASVLAPSMIIAPTSIGMRPRRSPNGANSAPPIAMPTRLADSAELKALGAMWKVPTRLGTASASDCMS